MGMEGSTWGVVVVVCRDWEGANMLAYGWWEIWADVSHVLQCDAGACDVGQHERGDELIVVIDRGPDIIVLDTWCLGIIICDFPGPHVLLLVFIQTRSRIVSDPICT